MIRYALRCAHGHGFDAWFRSSSAFDEQVAASQVSCAVCGERAVEKAVMAPSVVSGGAAPAAVPAEANRPVSDRPVSDRPVSDRPLSDRLVPDRPPSPLERALVELRRRIEASSDYVGSDFAAEARRIHEGESDERPIWGEATVADARALADDGIPVTPLPFMRRRDD